MNITSKKSEYEALVNNVLALAKAQGASAAEAAASTSVGFSVDVRKGEIETIEYNRGKSLGITVYFGQRKGSASTSDTSDDALRSTVEAACHIARFTNEDPCTGLASPDLMAYGYPDLSLHHPWELSVEKAIEMALECERLGMSADKRITNSEGSSVTTTEGICIYGNTHGFLGSYPTTRHSVNCVLIAQDEKGMQRDYSYTIARDPKELETITTVAKRTAMRTVRRLGARRLSTRQVPVIFEAEIAPGLLSCFLQAIHGGNLYRKSSFLVDQLGKQVFPAHVTLREDPHLKKGLGSSPFDGEGVITKARDLVSNGILQGYILGSYSARKLGMQTTGNAGGAHNIFINTSNDDLQGLLKKMDTGLLVTELLGPGINIVTGDYSRGATGFWVEKGVIQYPVEEITIAGNLRDMFRHLVAVGNDIDKRTSILTGSVLIETMTVAGE